MSLYTKNWKRNLENLWSFVKWTSNFIETLSSLSCIIWNPMTTYASSSIQKLLNPPTIRIFIFIYWGKSIFQQHIWHIDRIRPTCMSFGIWLKLENSIIYRVAVIARYYFMHRWIDIKNCLSKGTEAEKSVTLLNPNALFLSDFLSKNSKHCNFIKFDKQKFTETIKSTNSKWFVRQYLTYSNCIVKRKFLDYITVHYTYVIEIYFNIT